MVDAREYHERTKHSLESVRTDSFSLDFENQPRPYKVYENLPQVTLAAPPTPPAEAALSAVATSTTDPDSVTEGGASVDAQTLHTLCHYATGVTKELTRQGRRMRFRAASCTGKLYHVDLYAVTGISTASTRACITSIPTRGRSTCSARVTIAECSPRRRMLTQTCRPHR